MNSQAIVAYGIRAEWSGKANGTVRVSGLRYHYPHLELTGDEFRAVSENAERLKKEYSDCSRRGDHIFAIEGEGKDPKTLYLTFRDYAENPDDFRKEARDIREEMVVFDEGNIFFKTMETLWQSIPKYPVQQAF